MIQLIVYDLDGTLIDSSKDIANAVQFSLTQLGLPTVSETLVRSYVGQGVDHLIGQVLTEISRNYFSSPRLRRQAGAPLPKGEGVLEKAVALYKSHYSEHLLDETKLYPHVKETLHFLKSKKQAVISNKIGLFSRQILKGLGIDSYFFDVIGGDQVARKPAPDAVLKLIDEARVKPSETLFIGDSPIDVQTAKNANIKIAAVTYGFSSRAELEASQPDFIVDRIDEVINLGTVWDSTA